MRRKPTSRKYNNPLRKIRRGEGLSTGRMKVASESDNPLKGQRPEDKEDVFPGVNHLNGNFTLETERNEFPSVARTTDSKSRSTACT
jgi:hypothetical protein